MLSSNLPYPSLFLSHQSLPLRWQKTGTATPMAMATTMPRTMLVRHWMNGLRSNVTPLEPYKLDIASTNNNPWVRWATLIGNALVLIHHPHSEGPKPLLTRGATTKLSWKLYTIPSEERTMLEDESAKQPLKMPRGCCRFWKGSLIPWRRCARKIICLKLNLFKGGRLHRCTHGFESKGIDAIPGMD
jgi:hypothetical protein